jgi:hypothetical protein
VGVEFCSSDSENASNNLAWQPGLPVSIALKALSKDSTLADGRKVYSYELIPASFKESQGGSVTIKTNHPGKPEIKLPASLLK